MASVEGMEPDEQLELLLYELGNYRPDLLDRPRLVIESKADVAQIDADPERLQISAVTNDGLPRLIGEMAKLVRENRDEVPVGQAPVVHRPQASEISVGRAEDGGWLVQGRAAERAVALSDLTNLEALAYAQERLKKLGVNRKLARAGAKQGDTVYLGGLSFEYEEDVQTYD